MEDVRASLLYADVYYSFRVKLGDPPYATFRRNLFHMGRSIGSWPNPDAILVVTARFYGKSVAGSQLLHLVTEI